MAVSGSDLQFGLVACFKPLDAWRTHQGEVKFSEPRDYRDQLKLPCGQCVGCRLERSRQWAVRCMHEAQLHEHSSFVTLTYDDEHLVPSLDYQHFQKFMKRVRKKFGRVRFYMCGEYGEQFSRPHFHACLFGVFFSDRVPWKHLDSGSVLYRSAQLEALWPFGFSSVGDVTFESAAYIARYVMKKVTGDRADFHYLRVDTRTGEEISLVPEFNRMSLGRRKGEGIGGPWFTKFKQEVLCRDAVIAGGRPARVPRYYDVLTQAADGFLFDEIKYARLERALACVADSTPERLAVRESVASARLKYKKRTL